MYTTFLSETVHRKKPPLFGFGFALPQPSAAAYIIIKMPRNQIPPSLRTGWSITKQSIRKSEIAAAEPFPGELRKPG